MSDSVVLSKSDYIFTGQKKPNGGASWETLTPSNPFQTKLLSGIQLYSSQYKGIITRESEWSCMLIANKLKDRYNSDQRQFARFTFLNNDYLGVIAKEQAQGNVLIAFDQSWVLYALKSYFKDQSTYQTERTEGLRETSAKLYSGTREWNLSPELNGTPLDLKKEQIKIYSFYEGNKELLCVFAPLSVEEAEKILLYLYRDAEMYSYWVYRAIKDFSITTAADLKYLFPFEIDYFGDYTLISTDQISRERFDHILDFEEIPFKLTQLNDMKATYATYLLAEATSYQYKLRWENGTLYVGLCGFIQAQDLFEHFMKFLNDIEQEHPTFQPLDSYESAVSVARANYRCFYFLGKYYGVVNYPIHPEPIKGPLELDVKLIESIGPMIAVVRPDLARETKRYLQSMGYEITTMNGQNRIQLGHRTYRVDPTEVFFTVYYYRSTNGEENEIHMIEGSNNEEIKRSLIELLQRGYFFTQKIKNIIRCYPEFIPSDSPVKIILSSSPEEALEELRRLLEK